MYVFIIGALAACLVLYLLWSYFGCQCRRSQPIWDHKFQPASLKSTRDLSSDATFLKIAEASSKMSSSSAAIVRDLSQNNARNPIHLSYICAINVLTEYLPRSIIELIFELCDNCSKLKPPFIVPQYLENGWECKHGIMHDIPDLFVENVRPIANQPSLIITIGVPGSGKTTWAAKVRCGDSAHTQQNVVAADDYFDLFNKGVWSPKKIGAAHNWCQSEIFKRLNNGTTCVANNTNTNLWEMNAYVRYVVLRELPFKVVFAHMTEANVAVLSERGLHGVPAKKIKEMIKRLQYWRRRGPPTIQKVLKKLPYNRPPPNVSREVLYSGIFLEKSVAQEMRDYFVRVSGLPLLERTTDCHLTIKFKPSVDECAFPSRLPIGQKVWLRLVAYAAHPYVQCFLVDILDDRILKLVSNKYPHITLSYSRAVSAVYSNFLIEFGDSRRSIHPLIAKFDFVSLSDTKTYNKTQRLNDGLLVEGTIGYVQEKSGTTVLFADEGNVERLNNTDKNTGKRTRRQKRQQRKQFKSNHNSDSNAGNKRSYAAVVAAKKANTN